VGLIELLILGGMGRSIDGWVFERKWFKMGLFVVRAMPAFHLPIFCIPYEQTGIN
jgi:hypothetical protein